MDRQTLTNLAALVPDDVFMILGIALFGLLLVFIASQVGQRRREAVIAHLGFDAEVVYADRGHATPSLVSKEFGIVAKPDFVLRFDTGAYAVVEYKSRSSGRLFNSDVAQVKASVIAARELYDVSLAYVIVAGERHEVDVDFPSDELYEQIKPLVKHARAANAGEEIKVFATSEALCRGCAVRRNCQKPTRAAQ
jgi:CRISPR/Cas system-associated exonuclease Cas4 (RecB family)